MNNEQRDCFMDIDVQVQKHKTIPNKFRTRLSFNYPVSPYHLFVITYDGLPTAICDLSWDNNPIYDAIKKVVPDICDENMNTMIVNVENGIKITIQSMPRNL
jgi:hypothetical protein